MEGLKLQSACLYGRVARVRLELQSLFWGEVGTGQQINRGWRLRLGHTLFADTDFLRNVNNYIGKSCFWFCLENQFWQEFPVWYLRGCPSGDNHLWAASPISVILQPQGSCVYKSVWIGRQTTQSMSTSTSTHWGTKRGQWPARQPWCERLLKAQSALSLHPHPVTLGACYSSVNSLRVGLPAHKLDSFTPH